MVSGLQLWRRDVTDLPFRDDENLCQIVWCPRRHGKEIAPRVDVRWRTITPDAGYAAAEAPAPSQYASPQWIPAPCRVCPERIYEYPSTNELPPDVIDQVYAWADTIGWDYDLALGPAPGTKVCGWPAWPDPAPVLRCAAGHPMRTIVAVATGEYATGQESWLPAGDNPSPAELYQRLPGKFASTLMFGDAGSLFVAVCEICPDRPCVSII